MLPGKLITSSKFCFNSYLCQLNASRSRRISIVEERSQNFIEFLKMASNQMVPFSLRQISELTLQMPASSTVVLNKTFRE